MSFVLGGLAYKNSSKRFAPEGLVNADWQKLNYRRWLELLYLNLKVSQNKFYNTIPVPIINTIKEYYNSTYYKYY